MVVGAALILSAAMNYQPAAAPPDPLLRALESCRSQTNDAERLRCYDKAAAALGSAAATGDLVVVRQEDVKRTRRALFGFGVPKLPLFRGDRSAAEKQDQLEATIGSARSLGYGKWRIRLEDGAVWETTEAVETRHPKAGNKIVIKRGSLGSYIINVEGQRGVRAKRVS